MRPSVPPLSSRRWCRKTCPEPSTLVDAAYISAALLVQSQDEHGITLRGPTRPSPGWQAQVEGGYTIDQFEVDWAQQRVRCPQGKWSAAWWEHQRADKRPADLGSSLRSKTARRVPRGRVCTRAQQQGRRVGLPPRAQYEAVQAARAWISSEEGKQQYQRRAGVEGTLSQAVRSYGLRCARYWGADQNPLAARGDGRRAEYRSARGLARRAPAGEDADLPVRSARACLHYGLKVLWVFPIMSSCLGPTSRGTTRESVVSQCDIRLATHGGHGQQA